MVFLGVYYTLLDIGELGAEGLIAYDNKTDNRQIRTIIRFVFIKLDR